MTPLSCSRPISCPPPSRKRQNQHGFQKGPHLHWPVFALSSGRSLSCRELGPRLPVATWPTQSLCRRSFLILRALRRAASGPSSFPGGKRVLQGSALQTPAAPTPGPARLSQRRREVPGDGAWGAALWGLRGQWWGACGELRGVYLTPGQEPEVAE